MIKKENEQQELFEKEIVRLKEIIDKQQKEIEEKTTIIMAGAEKVKQLEKGNRSLMESRIKWKNRYYKEKEKEQNLIFQLKDEEKELIEVTQNIVSKDKIREKIKELKNIIEFEKPTYEDCLKYTIEILQELLEE